MPQQVTQKFCPNHGMVLAVRETPNHILHLILSVVTGGIWLVVWFLVSLKRKPALCQMCGSVTFNTPPRGWKAKA